jgi:hypothetical protein
VQRASAATSMCLLKAAAGIKAAARAMVEGCTRGY